MKASRSRAMGRTSRGPKVSNQVCILKWIGWGLFYGQLFTRKHPFSLNEWQRMGTAVGNSARSFATFPNRPVWIRRSPAHAFKQSMDPDGEADLSAKPISLNLGGERQLQELETALPGPWSTQPPPPGSCHLSHTSQNTEERKRRRWARRSSLLSWSRRMDTPN